jgi:hypothetical protein
MIPPAPSNQVLDRDLCAADGGGYFRTRDAQIAEAADKPDLFVGELRIPMALAARKPFRWALHASPTLPNHVLGIVGRRSEKQMRRVATGRVVAAMANKQIGRDWPVVNLIRDSMAAPLDVVEAKLAIVATGAISGPQPTLVGSAPVDLRPEPCDQLFIHGTNPPVGHGSGRSNAAGPFLFVAHDRAHESDRIR